MNNDFNGELAITLIPSDIYMGPRGPIMSDNLDELEHYFVYGRIAMVKPILHVCVDNTIVLTMRARYDEDVKRVLYSLCLVCYFPRTNCPCSSFIKRSGAWVLKGPRGESVGIDITRYGRRGRYIVAKYDNMILQGCITSRPVRQYGHGIYTFKVIADGFLIITLRVNNRHEIEMILNMLCENCYQMESSCHCTVFFRRCGNWQLEFHDRADVISAYYMELQGSDSEEELPSSLICPRNMWGGIPAWTQDTGGDVYRWLVDEIGTYPGRIVTDFLDGWENVIFKQVLDTMENEEPRRGSKRSKWTVLQGTFMTEMPRVDVSEILTSDSPYHLGVKLLEDVGTLIYYLRQSKTFEDTGMAVVTFVRSVTGQSVGVLIARLQKLMYKEIVEYFMLQDGDSWSNQFEDLYSSYASVKNSVFAQKVLKVLNTAVFQVVLHKMGIEADGDIIRRIEVKKMRPTVLNCMTFLDAISELVSFCLKQGRQYMLTGDLNVFFMDGDTISQWYVKARKLEETFRFLSNPDAIGVSIHQFLHDLDCAIADGASILKYLRSSSLEFKMIHTHQLRLETMKNDYLTMSMAQAIRRQPLGIVLYGQPGVGKSHILEMIYHYISKLRGLDPSGSYKFQHNSDEDYFTNFKSYMHTIVLDDVAQHRADKVQGIDKSLGLMIKLINNQPTCPPQAALDDKGKTPVLSELVIVTTNVEDLNIPHYFNKTYAVMRRLKVFIDIRVKNEFRNARGGIAGDIDNAYDDKWDFIIKTPREGLCMNGSFVEEKKLRSIQELLDYLKPIVEEHHRNQDDFLRSAANFRNVDLCRICRMPVPICERVGNCELEVVEEGVQMQGDVYTETEIGLEVHDRTLRGEEEPIEMGTPIEQETFIGEEFLGDDTYPVTAPWRLMRVGPVGPRRFLNEQIARAFIAYQMQGDRYNTTLEGIAQEYAYIHYPVMMRCGYHDDEIKRDFDLFKAHRYNTQDATRLHDMAHNICDGPWWKVKLSMIFFHLYFEWAIVRWLSDLLLSYTLTGRMMVWVFGHVVRSQRQRKDFMFRVGQGIDASLGGRHPLVKALCIWNVVSTVGLFYAFYLRATQHPREEHYFTDLKEAKKSWEEAEAKYKEKCSLYAKAKEKVREVIVEQSDRVTKSDLLAEYREERGALEKEYHEKKDWFDKRIEEISQERQDLESQGMLQEIGSIPEPAEGDDKTNIWVGSEKKVTTLDFCSDRATNMDAFQRALNLSCVRVDVTWMEADRKKMYQGRAMILSNSCVLINNHGVPFKSCVVRIQWSSVKGRICEQVEFPVEPDQVFRIVNRDLAIVNTKALPPMVSNFTRNFARSTFDGRYDGFLLVRMDDGSFKKHPVYGVTRINYQEQVGDRYFSCCAFRGTVVEPTIDGYCGSPLILETGYGPIVVGFHFLWRSCDRRVFASALFVEDFEYISTGVQGTCVTIEPYKIVKKNKSFIDFHEEGSVIYHGEIDYRVRYKTSVQPTEIKTQLLNYSSFGDFTFMDKFSKPLMHNYKPQQRSLAAYLKPSSGVSELRMAKCARVLVNNILTNLPEGELKLIKICTYEVAVNGMPGMAYVDSMKRSTSMGFPWHTTKRGFLEDLNDDMWPEGVKFTPDIEQVMEENLQRYMRGERCHPVFTSNLKDEVVSLKKFEIGKTRTFFSCPAPYLVIMRIFFLGFSRVVQRNWKVFHCVIGVNCHSNQWHEVFKMLTKHGRNRMVAGDFENFDKSFHMAFSRWTYWVITEICMASGNYDGLELVLAALGADFLNPTVNFFGMLITLLSGEVSGHQLTTIFNCMCSTMYLMYAYSEYYDVEEFFEYVSLLVLGDDNIQGVHPARPLHNHTNIRTVLNNLGVGYTMAEKEAESIPYIHIEECTFLKRSFKYSKELGCYVGPLDKESIMKMLMYQVQSKACSPSEQLAQAMVSASMEAFYHGRGFFDFIETCFNSLEMSPALVVAVREFPRFSWDENVDRFLRASGAAVDTRRNHKCISVDSNCLTCLSSSIQGKRVDLREDSARAFPKTPFQGWSRLKTIKEDKLECDELSTLDENKGLSKTNEELNNQQSSVPSTEGEVDLYQENTYFVQETVPEEIDLSTEHDPIANQQLLQADLGQFLSRPTKIAAYSWTIGASSGPLVVYKPWELYFNTPTIRNKLENFNFIRCNLKIKIVINASPFYYGSIGAFYNPIGYLGSQIGFTYNYTPGSQVLYSQRSHVWLDPQTTSTAVMKLPFLHFNNFLDVKVLSGFTDMGELTLVQFTGLQSANGVAAGSVVINIYAWAEDVELSGTTSKAALQGKISNLSSTVGSVANALSNVPGVGPFAKATEGVASAVGSVASFFGFTNVPVTTDVQPMKSLAFHTLASSEISEPINKLSLQPKQEVSVGQPFGDVSADPLHIANFAQRESFLCGSLWQTTNIEDDILFTSSVTPDLFEYNATGEDAWFPTPMAFAAGFFQAWRGSIIFRFKIIKSKYHRGRLNICWDVGVMQTNAMPAVGSPTVYNVVVDLDESDEVEIKVPYTQAQPFLNTYAYNNGTFWSNGPAPNWTGYGNGTIQIRVLNPLTAPVSTSAVNILTFVRAGDDIEFVGPTNMPRDKTLLELQGKIIELDGGAKPDPKALDEMYGERIVSFRELLHRQSKSVTQIIPKNVDWAGNQLSVTIPMQRLPRVYGYATNGWEYAAGVLVPGSEFNFNYVRNHPLIWIASCFVGYKGSTNWTFNAMNFNSKDSVGVPTASVTRRTDAKNINPRSWAANISASTSQLMRSVNTGIDLDQQGAAGTAVTNQLTQSGLSVNLPYYNVTKFLLMNLGTLYANSSSPDGRGQDVFEFTLRKYVPTSNVTDGDVIIDIYVGSGPDFNVIYFRNCPPVYALSPPTARATG